jgi:hypothetical protein
MSHNFENHINPENVLLTPQEAISFMTDLIPIINSGLPVRCYLQVHNSSRLNVLKWNANSILSKRLEFFDFLLENSINIALLNETQLKPGTGFSHPDYRCYRLDRVGRSKGGVAVMVRHNLPHTLLSSFRTRVIECIGVSVDSSGTESSNFISAYLPGARYSIEDISNFRNDILHLTSSQRILDIRRGVAFGPIRLEMLFLSVVAHLPYTLHQLLLVSLLIPGKDRLLWIWS